MSEAAAYIRTKRYSALIPGGSQEIEDQEIEDAHRVEFAREWFDVGT